MTAQTSPAEAPTSTDDELLHIACCEDWDVALCGCDLSDDRKVDESCPLPHCKPCDILVDFDCAADGCPVSVLRDLLRGGR